MNKKVKVLIPLLPLLAIYYDAPADVLLIEEVRHSQTLNLPTSGMSMESVEAGFGAPTEKRGAVGEPPISRWIYDEYSVYFEYDRVISSVLHHGAVLDET